jgi:hypothetical protein
MTQFWEQFTNQGENWLLNTFQSNSKADKGRGQGCLKVRNTISAPQFDGDGKAETKSSITIKSILAAAKRMSMFTNKPTLNDHEQVEFSRLIEIYDNPKGTLPSIQELQLRVEKADEDIKQNRKQVWKEYCEHNWAFAQGKLYRWIKKTTPAKAAFQQKEKPQTAQEQLGPHSPSQRQTQQCRAILGGPVG